MSGRPEGILAPMAAAVRSGQTSSQSLVEECLRRIEILDPALNSVVALRAGEALAEAVAVDASVASGTAPQGPLLGVPVLVKDLEDVAGLATRKGSLLFADVPPAIADGHTPARLRAAGAIVVGKTALPEFAIEGYTANLLTGVTRNPWAPEWSPGGSSGGSGAALSAGLAPIATATDGGGSVRIPAAFCGLVGLKPTRGVVARTLAPDWIDLTTDGPLATTVADVRLLLAVMSGYASGDPDVVFASATRSFPELPARVFVAERTSDLGPLPPGVATSFASAYAAFADLVGAHVVHLDQGTLFGAHDPDLDWFTLATADHVAALGRSSVENGLARMHPSSRDFLGHGLGVTIDDYLAVRRRRYEYVQVIDELLGDDAVLLTPTVAVGGILADGRLSRDGVAGPLPPEVYSTALQNMTGSPAITVPAGRCGELPFGLQVTGPRFGDGWLLDLAQRWEQAHPWSRHAPGYEPFAAE